MNLMTIRTIVNGRDVEATISPRLSLADFLRDHVHLTGTKVGCEQGVCGTCTIHLDGYSVRSCLLLAVQADGHVVDTVEGLSTPGEFSELQLEFSRQDALQCGFCTAGMLMTCTEILKSDVTTEHEIRDALSGNLCRCTGYRGVIAAVMATKAKGTQ